MDLLALRRRHAPQRLPSDHDTRLQPLPNWSGLVRQQKDRPRQSTVSGDAEAVTGDDNVLEADRLHRRKALHQLMDETLFIPRQKVRRRAPTRQGTGVGERANIHNAINWAVSSPL